MSLNIDYGKVEGALTKIQGTLSASSIEADYSALLVRFVESKGKEATAIIDMITAEKALAVQLNSTLSKFAGGIQATINEFKTLDKGAARTVKGSSTGGGIR